MEITDKVSGQDLAVYGIYWSSGQTFFCCFPKQSKGMNSYRESEVDVANFDVGPDFVFSVMSNGIRGVFHKALLPENLLDSLLEFDPEAYNKFVVLLGHTP